MIFIDFKKYEIKRTRIKPHLHQYDVYDRKTGEFKYTKYNVHYANQYIKSDRVFDLLSDADEYAEYLRREHNKQTFHRRVTTEYNRPAEHTAEWPENILIAIGIKPNDYENYYTEIIPSFDSNFTNVTDNGPLTERELNVILLTYKKYETFATIGAKYNLTRERVRQIHNRAISKLSHISFKRVFLNNQIAKTNVPFISKTDAIETVKKLCTRSEIVDILKSIPDDELNTPIDELNLSVRSYNALKNSGYKTLNDVVNATEIELLQLHSLGKKSLKEIKKLLNAYGYEIKS